MQVQKQYLDYLIDPNFQGVNSIYHLNIMWLEQHIQDSFFQKLK